MIKHWFKKVIYNRSTSIKESLDDVTNEGTAETPVIIDNIYKKYGNIPGTIVVMLLSIIGIVVMTVIGLYGALKSLIKGN